MPPELRPPRPARLCSPAALVFGLVATSAGSSPARAGDIRGVVENARGEAMVDTAVQVFDQHLRGGEVRTDRTGAFAFEDLPEGRYRLRAVPELSQDEVWRFHPQAPEFCEATVFDIVAVEDPDSTGTGSTSDHLGITLTLPFGGRMTGVVTDEDGLPVPGATVWAVSPQDETASRVRADFTDDAGVFELRGLDVAAGLSTWAIGATSPSHPEQYLGGVYDEVDGTAFAPEGATNSAPGPVLDTGSHALLSGITVSGEVRSEDTPVTEGTVHVYAGGQVRSVSLDESGRYEAIGLPPGDVLPWVSAPGVALTYWPLHDRPTEFASAPEEGLLLEGMDITAPPESTLFLRLVDEETGAPINDISALIYNDTQTVGLGGGTDDSGTVFLDGLWGGAWYVYVWAADMGFVDGFLTEDDGEDLLLELEAETENQEVELAVPRAAVVSGTVVDEAGEPIDNAAVVLLRADGTGEAGRSEEDGRFTIGGLPGDTFQLWAEYSPYCPQDPSYVTAYWGDTVNPDWQEWIEIPPAERIEGIELVLEIDADQDQMGDTWEREHGLDPERDDSREDPDGDEYINLEEYRMGTDPQDGTPALGCSCSDGSAGLLLLLPVPLALRRRR